MTIPIALVGMGKIARDQHLPALAENAGFQLVGTVDPAAAGIEDVPHFADLGAALAGVPNIRAVSLCTPPQVRSAAAVRALQAGLHVMLEKPPAASLSRASALAALAQQGGCTLFASWHSREAGGVAGAKAWLRGQRVKKVSVIWREDVRKWHPGQQWIWQAGGLGVFDPGINALSILTAILPEQVALGAAQLEVPENCQSPIAARLEMSTGSGTAIHADFDFRQTGKQTWDISVETDAGVMLLSDGGASLALTGQATQHFPDREYASLYARFARLIERGESDVDLSPFRLVADAFLLGSQTPVEPFIDTASDD